MEHIRSYKKMSMPDIFFISFLGHRYVKREIFSKFVG